MLPAVSDYAAEDDCYLVALLNYGRLHNHLAPADQASFWSFRAPFLQKTGIAQPQ